MNQEANRIDKLEDLCELLTKQVIEQNKSIITVNQNLINEIRLLRQVIVEQDENVKDSKKLIKNLGETIKNNLTTMASNDKINLQHYQQQVIPPPQPQILNQLNYNLPLNLQQQQPPTLNKLQHPPPSTFQQPTPPSSFQPPPSSFQQQQPPPASFQQQQPPPASFQQPPSSAFQQQQPPPQIFQKQQPPPPVIQQQQQPQIISSFTNIQTPPSTLAQPTPSSQSKFEFKAAQIPQPPIEIKTNHQEAIKITNGTGGFSGFVFGGGNKTTPEQQPQQQPQKTPLFQFASPLTSNQTQNSPKQPDFTSLNANKPMSFADLKTPSGDFAFGGNGGAVTSPFAGTSLFGNTPAQSLFANQTASTMYKPGGGEEGEDETNEDPGEYEPNVEFTPLVKLDLVEVKTGEEDEEAIFKERCKLYCFSTEAKEWKEKGVGEMKILKHKTNDTYRILMRRDQVLKLCANHRITSDLKLQPVTDKQWRWFAQDYSDGTSKSEILLVKFKLEKEAKLFKEKFDEALQAVLNHSTSEKPKNTPKPTPKPAQPALSELFKKDTNAWTCDSCYVVNKVETTKCLACGALKPGTTAPSTAITESKIQFPPSNPLQKTDTTPAKPFFSFGTPSTQTTGAKVAFGSTFSFGAPAEPIKTSPFQNLNLVKQQPTPISTQKSPQSGSSSLFNLIPQQNALSFADLAKQTPTTSATGGVFAFGNGSPLFGGGGVGKTQPLFGSQTPTVLFGAKPTPTVEEGDEEDNEDLDEYEPNVEFTPLCKLEEVEVKTGEEDEEAIFKERCKLYRFSTETKEWKEKGVGEMKILKHKTNDTYRILMRRDQVLKLCANHRITSDLKLEAVTDKQWRWFAHDYSDGSSKAEILAAKFKLEKEAKLFKEKFDEALQAVLNHSTSEKPKDTPKPTPKPAQPALSELFKKDTNAWTCDSCYVVNKVETTKCLACGALKPGTTSTVAQLTTSFNNLTNIVRPSNDGGSESKFSFGKPVNGGGASVLFETKFDANKIVTTPVVSGKTDMSSLGDKPSLSFADLAKQTPPGGFAFGSGANKTLFGGMGGGATPVFGAGQAALPLFGVKGGTTPLFGQTPPTTNGGDEGEEEGNANPEEYEPNVSFTPLVKLKEVEVKTGEEDEEAIFKERCKLYRFTSDTKEWKEKGVGEMKILYNQTYATYRILMRRDQVLKLCANHRITADLKLEYVTDKQWRWFAQDYSEGSAKSEILLVKFKHEREAKLFKEQFDRAQNDKTIVETTKSSTVTPIVDSLSHLKPKNGSWSCSECLTENKADSQVCACCSHSKEGLKVVDDDISFVSETKANEDQRNKARSFLLPDNFYLYETKQNCPGCIGCEK